MLVTASLVERHLGLHGELRHAPPELAWDLARALGLGTLVGFVVGKLMLRALERSWVTDHHQGPAAVGVVDLNSVQSIIPAAEVNVLTEVGAYIAAKVSEQTVSMVATENTGRVKSSVERNPQGVPVLELRVDYDRAWATLGQALTRAEVEVNDSDQLAGVYSVRVPQSVLTGEKKGWLSGLFSRGRDAYALQLHVEQAADTVYHVSVTDDEDEPVDREFGQEVLIMIREFAS